MTDTPQPEAAGETESVEEQFADAAHLFKMNLPEQADTGPLRDPATGKFVSQEIEAEEQPTGEAEAESHEEAETEEAAEEAQPEAVDLPPSWPAELAEEWQSLPAPLQDTIVRREAERESAINAKFQEAANVRKANEALIAEANTNRQRFVEETEFVLGLVNPQRPPTTMLNPASSDYNPDAYHLAVAQFEEANDLIGQMRQRTAHARAQAQEEARQAHYQNLVEVNERYGPELLRDVPDIGDETKASAAIGEIARYAVSLGVPEQTFADPEQRMNLTAPVLHILWKAQQFDKMKSAKAKVVTKAAKPAAPPVKPGVTTPRSAVEGAKRKADFARLDKSGSIADGAAVFKHFL
jgi:hypothetical protein